MSRALSLRGRVCGALAGAALIAVLGSAAGAGMVWAASDGSMPGEITVTPIPPGETPIQLLAGTDGSLWFVTASSQLGEVNPAGQASLTGVTLPKGTMPATLAAAGAQGVWVYASTLDYTDGVFACTVTLVRPDGSVFDPTLPTGAVGHYCDGATGDAGGNLWISLREPSGSGCGCRVGLVAEITPTGAAALWRPVSSGAFPSQMTLGSDGAVWVLEGQRDAFVGRYSASGPPTGFASPTPQKWTGIWGRPDGSLWVAREIYDCSNSCETATVAVPGVSQSAPHIFPVSTAGSQYLVPEQDQLAVAPDGGLWIAGRENAGVTRFFRMNGSGGIDRSHVLPTGAGGSALEAAGPIAVTTGGTAWSVVEGGGDAYLARFAPAGPLTP
ncbi:MAG: hypothetical protein WB802_01525 [Candidatus Dormiibacterota bacterium]